MAEITHLPHIVHLLSEDLATGTLKQIELLCQGLGQCGFEQSICSFEPNHRRRAHLPSCNGRLSFCSRNGKLDPTFPLRLRRQLSTLDPALIQTWGGTAASSGIPLAAMQVGVPVVCAIRSFENETTPAPVVDRWLGRYATRTIVNNDQLKDVLVTRGVPAQLIDVVGNAVQPAFGLGAVGPLHHELGLDDAVRFVAVVGDLRVNKQIKDLIWAMDLLRVIHPEMHLLIVGEGDEMDRLRRFDRDVNLDRCVHFLGRRGDVRQLLAQCLCLWQASRDEGCSNAVLEALAVGLPVVASDVPGHKSLVVPGETGYLVPLGDCAEYARKTNRLIQNERLRHDMGVAGQCLVKRHYAPQQMIDGYRNIYQSVLMGRSGRAASKLNMTFSVFASMWRRRTRSAALHLLSDLRALPARSSRRSQREGEIWDIDV